MEPLSETNPGLVAAAKEALLQVEPVGPEQARVTTFEHQGHMYWTKVTIDPHANTVERWDILPAGFR